MSVRMRRAAVAVLVAGILGGTAQATPEEWEGPRFAAADAQHDCSTIYDLGTCAARAAGTPDGELAVRATVRSSANGLAPGFAWATGWANVVSFADSWADARSIHVVAAVRVRRASATSSASLTGGEARVDLRLSGWQQSCGGCYGEASETLVDASAGSRASGGQTVVLEADILAGEGEIVPAGALTLVVEMSAYSSLGSLGAVGERRASATAEVLGIWAEPIA